MAAKREAERRALADALLEESFRENCDPLRERYTRQIIYKTAAERQQQVGGGWVGGSGSSSVCVGRTHQVCSCG
jgi:hypothetical protein